MNTLSSLLNWIGSTIGANPSTLATTSKTLVGAINEVKAGALATSSVTETGEAGKVPKITSEGVLKTPSIEVGSKAVTDFVVVTGESAIASEDGDGYWRWREWSSGKVEAWYFGSLTLNATTSPASGVTRREKWFDFPNNYSLNKCMVTVGGMNSGSWCGCGGVQNSSSTTTPPFSKFEVMVYQINGAPNQTQTQVSVYICGEKSV